VEEMGIRVRTVHVVVYASMETPESGFLPFQAAISSI
jgi:hypothetical protein